MRMVEKYRIVEWTGGFRDGSRIVACELQSQVGKKWKTQGTSPSLVDARKGAFFSDIQKQLRI